VWQPCRRVKLLVRILPSLSTLPNKHIVEITTSPLLDNLLMSQNAISSQADDVSSTIQNSVRHCTCPTLPSTGNRTAAKATTPKITSTSCNLLAGLTIVTTPISSRTPKLICKRCRDPPQQLFMSTEGACGVFPRTPRQIANVSGKALPVSHFPAVCKCRQNIWVIQVEPACYLGVQPQYQAACRG
jgi:hypothetical protein